MHENDVAVFKREYADDIKKEVTAFADSGGGVICVGRDGDGNIYPLTDIDGVLTRIADGIRDGLLPDVTEFVRYETDERGIVVTVSEADHKPTFCRKRA